MHKFVEVDGGTLILDEIRYALPLGWIGNLVHGLIVQGQLQKIFDHRAHVIERMFGEAEPVDRLI